VESREVYGVELLGPVSRHNQWQAKAGKGYDQSGCALDCETQTATCPQGHQSVHWLERTDQHGHPHLLIRFDQFGEVNFCSEYSGLRSTPGSSLKHLLLALAIQPRGFVQMG
jgi:hypothetical protein